MSKNVVAWHAISSAQALKKLNSQVHGLSDVEAARRLLKYGHNVLAQGKKVRGLTILLGQFKSALVYVLLVASITSLLFREFIDAYVILAAVIINVVVGFIQEYKANKSLEKLNQVVKPQSLVWRNNREIKIASADLVAGDIIYLQSGDRVPADLRLLEVNNLEINEAVLTGESWPVKKTSEALSAEMVLAERTNMAYLGTLVVEGRGQGLIVATGRHSEMGQVTKLLQDTVDEKTPLQLKLDNLASGITKIIVLVALGLFIFGLIKGYAMPEMFTIAVAVAVSAIPEGLVISMTMILTIGMQRILRHNGLVRRLVSAETLGSTTVICTDKTGTLTEGEMRVVEIISASHHLDLAVSSIKDIEYDEEIQKIWQVSLLCNNASVENPDSQKKHWQIIASPTEKALFVFAIQYQDYQQLNKKFARQEELPFDSEHKFMLTRHHYDNSRDIIFMKGACEVVLGASAKFVDKKESRSLSDQKRADLNRAWQELSQKGLRVLGGAYKLVAKNQAGLAEEKNKLDDFTFIGFWGLADPLRPEAKETIELTKQAGIQTVIITGDNKFTAQSIAQQLGLEIGANGIVSGDELINMDDETLAKRISEIKVYARVTPSDKLRIIKAWQKRGEVVSMTGDGVNDAPALKAADVGVAVMSGSDVARETADLVLLDNNFATIVMAIKEGRVIFSNIKKVILYLLSGSFSEVVLIIVALILQVPLPLLTAQILWINLVSDSFPALALTMEPEEEEVMNRKPSISKSLFNLESKFLIVAISLISGLSSLWLFWGIWHDSGNLALARTTAFTALGLVSLLYIFSIRSLENNIFKAGIFRNNYLNVAILVGVLAQVVAVYLPVFNKFLHTVPLGWIEWRQILLVIAFVIIFIEVIKLTFDRLAKLKK